MSESVNIDTLLALVDIDPLLCSQRSVFERACLAVEDGLHHLCIQGVFIVYFFESDPLKTGFVVLLLGTNFL